MRAGIKADTERIAKNFSVLKSGFKKEVKAICVLKADAYGHGAKKVAAALADADGFAVATAKEAEEILFAEKSVILLGGSEREEREFLVEKGVEISVWEERDIAELTGISRKIGKAAKIQIAIDSGMNRIGVKTERELSAILRAAVGNKNVEITGVFSHFYDPSDKDARERQKRAFGYMAGLIPFSVPRHIAATDALKYGDVFFDAVRLGIGLYGYGAEGVSPALTVFGRVIRTARLETGETVGYGGEYVASGGETVATVALGYADGLPRTYSGGYILIGGKRRKVIGRICMDMCFSEADESVKAGDTAVFLGRQGNEEITAEEIARKVGTIPYEILVGFKRIPFVK